MDNFGFSTSIILITYNKIHRLPLTLESIKRAKGINDVELIIVNDGSSDGTKELIDEYITENPDMNIKVIHINNSGRSIARNTGIMASSGDLIIFIDDDLIFGEKFIISHQRAHVNQNKLINHGIIYSFPLIKFMANPSNGELYSGGYAKKNLMKQIIELNMLSDNKAFNTYINYNARLSKFEADLKNLYNNTDINDSYVRWMLFTGGNVSVRRALLYEVENFDPYMGKTWGCEDLEIGYRLYKVGCSFSYDYDASNYHLSHYRENSIDVHNKSIDYFNNKHKAKSISLLKKYFNGDVKSLLQWKGLIDEETNSQC